MRKIGDEFIRDEDQRMNHIRFVRKYQVQSAVLALILLSILWGYNWVVMKVALKYCDPFSFGALRTFLGALILFAVLFIRGGDLLPKAVPQVMLLGLLQTTGFIGFMMWALVAGGAGKTAVLVYTMPFWALVLARLFLHERVHGIQWLAVVLAFTGLLFVFDPWQPHGSPASKILACLSGLSWAASVIVAKRLQEEKEMGLLTLTAWQMLFGSIPLVVLGMLRPGVTIAWSGYFIGALLYNIIPCNALAFILWLFIVRNLPAGVAGIASLVTPLFGVICAWVELGEKPGYVECVGMLLIGVALLFLTVWAIRNHYRCQSDKK